MFKHRANRVDNGELVEGYLVVNFQDTHYIHKKISTYDEAEAGAWYGCGIGYKIDPSTLEIEINGEWWKPDMVASIMKKWTDKIDDDIEAVENGTLDMLDQEEIDIIIAKRRETLVSEKAFGDSGGAKKETLHTFDNHKRKGE